MTAGMAGVIAAHEGFSNYNPLGGGESYACSCGARIAGRVPENWHAAHVAEELTKAGYGDTAQAAHHVRRDALAEVQGHVRDELEQVQPGGREPKFAWRVSPAVPLAKVDSYLSNLLIEHAAADPEELTKAGYGKLAPHGVD